MFGARVVTQNVLLREIGGNLIERHVKLIGSFWKINSAAGLLCQLFHTSFSRECAQVCAFIQSGLDHVDLAIVRENVLHYKIEIAMTAGGFDTVRDDDEDPAAGIRSQVSSSVDDRIKQ